MNTNTSPDPAFVDALEWQLRREVRRAERFGPAAAPRRHRGRRAALLVALALASGLTGAAGLAAGEQVQASRRAETIVKIMAWKDRTARLAYERAAANAEDAEARQKAGLASGEEVTREKRRLVDATEQLQNAELNLAEARATGQRPREELSAPKVDDRDFVGERLRASRIADAAFMTFEQVAHGDVVKLFDSGLVPRDALIAATLNLQLAELKVQGNEARLAARERFLAGVLSATDVEREDLKIAATYRLRSAEARTQIVAERLQRARTMCDAGLATSAELRRVEDELAEVEAEAEIAQEELKSLQE